MARQYDVRDGALKSKSKADPLSSEGEKSVKDVQLASRPVDRGLVPSETSHDVEARTPSVFPHSPILQEIGQSPLCTSVLSRTVRTGIERRQHSCRIREGHTHSCKVDSSISIVYVHEEEHDS